MRGDRAAPLDAEPWRGLTDEVADLIEPELGGIGAATIAAISREVPEYAKPLEGRFGHGVRTGVEEALRQFVALIRDPDIGREGRGVYVALGRGEFEQGRTLDSLQAAYRVGARVAWRRLSAAGRESGLDPEISSLLAEAIFAYIDELAADAVEGYAEARSEVEDSRRRRLRELVAALVSGSASEAEIRDAAAALDWTVPRTAAALACAEDDLGRVSRRLAPDCVGARLEGAACFVVPDPDGPGRRTELGRAVEGRGAAIGPTVSSTDLAASWELARAAHAAARAGALPDSGLIATDDHLADLVLLREDGLAERLARRRLAPLDALTAKARARMSETALAFVRHGGNAVAMAAELHVHPQTVRYRVTRLRELLGEALEDPDARFELELALRGRALRVSDGASAAAS